MCSLEIGFLYTEAKEEEKAGAGASKKAAEEVDGGRQGDGDSGLHPRTKSTARRRPKRERRSTGIKFEVWEE